VRGERDEAFIRDNLDDLTLVGVLPYSDQAIEADMQSKALYDMASEMVKQVNEIIDRTLV